MKLICTIFFLFGASVTSVTAFTVYQTEVTKPYEIISLQQDLEKKQAHIGQLENFPIMYAVTVVATTTFTTQLSQRYQGSVAPLSLALMLVREDDTGGGVSEVMRTHPEVTDWDIRKDAMYGMSFLDSAPITSELRPGTYRIEVSTPDNLGRYMLTLGTTEEKMGYFEALAHVRTVQQGFGLSIGKMLGSSYVYYPLGIILLLFIMQRTWRFRKVIAHVD
ncbi:hypothetical protein GW937_00835 [Candidatus Kaiserbacteria bacterium]|nr:hypothetical protein [Candidatus Kaiserbacteria bacterium]NCT01655.1 hypothetical protein [Candidatus Parcubacteria bacterium]